MNLGFVLDDVSKKYETSFEGVFETSTHSEIESDIDNENMWYRLFITW
jgi:hypothetical protein